MSSTIEDIYVNDFGFSIVATIEQDGVALDISGFTGYIFILTKPNGVTVTKTAALVTDGKDGKINYTVEAAVFDVAGTWKIQGRVTTASAESTSRPGYIPILERLD